MGGLPMSGSGSGHDDEPSLVEDPQTGERYLMYALPIGVWPAAPRVVYECSVCKCRSKPADWSNGCPDCSGHKSKRRRKKKR